MEKQLSKSIEIEEVEKIIDEFYQNHAGDSKWHIPLKELKQKLTNKRRCGENKMKIDSFICPSCKSEEWKGKQLIHKPNCQLDMLEEKDDERTKANTQAGRKVNV